MSSANYFQVVQQDNSNYYNNYNTVDILYYIRGRKQMWQNANIGLNLSARYMGVQCNILETYLYLKKLFNKNLIGQD